MTNTTHTDAMLALMLADKSFSDFGLRVIDGDASVGDVLAPSRVWIDGEPTDGLLAGASAIHIRRATADAIVAALAIVGATDSATSYYPGRTVLLVAGEIVEHGYDDGEVILRDARVVGVWYKSSDGAGAIRATR